MEKICSQLDKYQKALIKDYKKAGMKAKEIFSFNHSFCGHNNKKYCLYFGFQLIGISDTKKEIITLRSRIFNNI